MSMLEHVPWDDAAPYIYLSCLSASSKPALDILIIIFDRDKAVKTTLAQLKIGQTND